MHTRLGSMGTRCARQVHCALCCVRTERWRGGFWSVVRRKVVIFYYEKFVFGRRCLRFVCLQCVTIGTHSDFPVRWRRESFDMRLVRAGPIVIPERDIVWYSLSRRSFHVERFACGGAISFWERADPSVTCARLRKHKSISVTNRTKRGISFFFNVPKYKQTSGFFTPWKRLALINKRTERTR